MDSIEKVVLDFLHDAMHDAKSAALHLHELPEEFQAFGKELCSFCQCVEETAALARSLSEGDLNIILPPPSNQMAAPLKSLHATLKHLTWQTQRVAQRDYQQRVDFMGDFSKAFNTMTEHLQKQHAALLREIENRQRQITALSQNKSLYELLVGQIQQWIIVADADTGKYLFISREVEDALSDPVSEHQMRRWMIRQMREGHEVEGMRTAELELNAHDCIQYYSASIHPLHWCDRRAFAFVLTDVSREREQLHTLQNIANFDTLTQVYSRRYGMDLVEQWLEEKREFALSFVDIDNLKYVNDRFGHTEGDQYIMLVANMLREFSADVTVCRIGGDEFMLLVENWSVEAVSERMEVLRRELIAQKHTPDIVYEHSMSYGVVSIQRGDTLLVSDLLSIADERMYEYKRAYKLKRKRHK